MEASVASISGRISSCSFYASPSGRLKIDSLRNYCHFPVFLYDGSISSSFQGRESGIVLPHSRSVYDCSGFNLRCRASSAGENVVGEREQDAQSVIEHMLHEAGLSVEDARSVASNSPIFVQRLLRSAEEMEELSILTISTVQQIRDEQEFAELEPRALFTMRLRQAADRFMGSTMIPFLESLGVQMPHVNRLLRILSSQPLSELSDKIMYVKQLLSRTELKGIPVDTMIRQLMRSMSLPVDEDLQQTLSFFEKMEAIRGGLSLMRKSQLIIPYFLESFPQIFMKSLEEDLMPIMHHLEGLGVPQDSLGWVMLCFPPILLQSTGDLQLRTRRLKKAGVSSGSLGQMLVKYPWLVSRAVESNLTEIIELLLSIKVPKGKIASVLVKYPRLLGCSTTNLLQMVQSLNDIGVKSRLLGKVITLNPQLLVRTPQQLNDVVALLQGLGIESTDLRKIMRRSPEVFASNVDATLKVKLKFLQEIGVQKACMRRIVRFYPELLTMSVEEALRPRIDYLGSAGFCKKDIAYMVSLFPPILGYNIKPVLEPKLKFLTQTMGRSISEVVKYPKYFSYSLEKKIQPRARVLARREISCDLKSMLGMNDDEFAAQYLGFQKILIPPI